MCCVTRYRYCTAVILLLHMYVYTCICAHVYYLYSCTDSSTCVGCCILIRFHSMKPTERCNNPN